VEQLAVAYFTLQGYKAMNGNGPRVGPSIERQLNLISTDDSSQLQLQLNTEMLN
jgi:hypothetical protein